MKTDNLTPHSSIEYELNIQKTIPYYNQFHDETINLIKSMDIKPNIWLDTGCGTGTLVKKAIQHFKNTNFILSDPSMGMLNQAQKKLEKYDDRVNFLKPAATHELDLKSRADIVTTIQSHHYMNKKERFKATKTCYKILNENGVFITFENIRPFTKKGIEIGKKYWKNFQISKGKSKKDVEIHLTRFDREYFPITVEEHINLLKSSGFKIVELLWYSYMQAGFYGIK